MVGAQASNDQLEKILSYLDIGRQEGAKVLAGGERASVDGLDGGFYVQPTVFEGTNDMRVFQEEIFGPVVSVTTFRDFDHAMEIANDTLYGLGAGVWTRDGNTAYRAGRAACRSCPRRPWAVRSSRPRARRRTRDRHRPGPWHPPGGRCQGS